MTDELAEPADLFPLPVSQQLSSARDAKGLTLENVAEETRIPLRHLYAIEAGDFAALPSSTYAVGFVRAFARVVDADEVALAAQVREEMGLPSRPGATIGKTSSMAPPEPDRIPPRAFAWTAALLAVLLIGGFLIWRSGSAPETTMTAALDGPATTEGQAVPPSARTPVAPTGEVVLTATDEVWIQVRDGAGATLVSRTLQPGERFTVPVGAPEPTVTVGRPEALTVTVGGQEVAPLGPAGRAVSDAPVTAAALTSRNETAPPV